MSLQASHGDGVHGHQERELHEDGRCRNVDGRFRDGVDGETQNLFKVNVTFRTGLTFITRIRRDWTVERKVDRERFTNTSEFVKSSFIQLKKNPPKKTFIHSNK